MTGPAPLVTDPDDPDTGAVRLTVQSATVPLPAVSTLLTVSAPVLAGSVRYCSAGVAEPLRPNHHQPAATTNTSPRLGSGMRGRLKLRDARGSSSSRLATAATGAGEVANSCAPRAARTVTATAA